MDACKPSAGDLVLTERATTETNDRVGCRGSWTPRLARQERFSAAVLMGLYVGSRFDCMEPFGNGAWPRHQENIEQALNEVEHAHRGLLLLYFGDPALGRTRLLADALVRLSRRRPRPSLMAGGFDVVGARGDYTSRPLPGGRLGSPAALRALGYALGIAGATVAVPNPAGTLRVAGAVASLLGQVGQAASEVQESAERFQDPDELLDALRRRLRDGRPLVLCLADVDRAVPPMLWWQFFLLRLLPPLLSAHPLLVLATAATTGALAGSDDLAELRELELCRSVELRPYTAREIAAEIGDEDLAEDVTGLTGGDPERVAAQFAGWRRDGLVEHRDGGWRYAFEREAALPGAGVQVRRVLVLALGSADSKPHDRAVRVLRTAALEGMTFTVQALARVLEEDSGQLSDWLDDQLVVDAAHPFAPLVAAGFVEGTSLFRYSFRSRLLWTVMHPIYGRQEWHEPLANRGLMSRYADALAVTYGPRSQEAIFPIWELRRVAGDADAGHYARLANSLASAEAAKRVLDADLKVDDATLSRTAVTAAIRRFVAYARQALPVVAHEDFLTYALRHASPQALPGLISRRVVRRRARAALYGRARCRWRADSVRFAAQMLDELPHCDARTTARRLDIAADRLVELLEMAQGLHFPLDEEWSSAVESHLNSRSLGLRPSCGRGRREEPTTRIRARITELLDEERRLLPMLAPTYRPHRELHLWKRKRN